MNTLTRGGLAVAAAALIVAAPLAAAPAASAHTAVASLDCDGWSASAVAYDEAATGLVIVDGVTVHDGPFGGAGELSGAWATEAKSHRLQVSIDSSEDRYDYTFDETISGCLPEVPPTEEPPTEQPPVVVPQIQDYVGECDAAFVLDNTGSTLPVVYHVNGIRYLVEAGAAVHTDADGTRIEPMSGAYYITTDTGRSWEFPARECPTPTEPPVVEPPAEEPPTVEPPVEAEEPPVVDEPTEDAPEVVEAVSTPIAPEPTPVARTATTLPVTGADDWAPLGIVALALMLGGAGILTASRLARR